MLPNLKILTLFINAKTSVKKIVTCSSKIASDSGWLWRNVVCYSPALEVCVHIEKCLGERKKTRQKAVGISDKPSMSVIIEEFL